MAQSDGKLVMFARAVKRHKRQNDLISAPSPKTKKRVFVQPPASPLLPSWRQRLIPNIGRTPPPCAPQRRPSAALNAFPPCRTGFWGKNTGSELGPETIQWGTSTLFDIMDDGRAHPQVVQVECVHDGERNCKKNTIFWAVFIESRIIFEGVSVRGCSLSGQMRPCAIVAGPGQGPRDPGPIVALACERPRTTCSKARTRDSGQ